MNTYFKKNKSVFFFVFVLILSVLFLWFGSTLASSENTTKAFIGMILLQSASITITALLAMLFLNLDETRHHILTSVADALAQGALPKLLTTKAKEQLERDIALNDLSETNKNLDPGLYDHLKNTRDRALSNIIITNHFEDIRLRDYEDNPDLVIREQTKTYRMTGRHLHEGKDIDIRCYMEAGFKEGVSIEPSEFLLDFKARLGDIFLEKKDVVDKIIIEKSGTMTVLTLDFTQKVKVEDALDVNISSSIIGWKDDNVEVLITKYPTNGLRVSFRYLENLSYDSAWLKSWELNTGIKAGREHLQTHNDGLTAYTNDWVLPGEGIVFSWHPK